MHCTSRKRVDPGIAKLPIACPEPKELQLLQDSGLELLALALYLI